MNTANIIPEPKKLVGKLITICITCGSEKISSNKYAILCEACGTHNFCEEAGQ